MQVRDDIGKILELVLQWKGKSSVGRYGSVGICLQSETDVKDISVSSEHKIESMDQQDQMLFRRKDRGKWSGNCYRYGNNQDQRENRDLQSRCRYREATVQRILHHAEETVKNRKQNQDKMTWVRDVSIVQRLVFLQYRLLMKKREYVPEFVRVL